MGAAVNRQADGGCGGGRGACGLWRTGAPEDVRPWCVYCGEKEGERKWQRKEEEKERRTEGEEEEDEGRWRGTNSKSKKL